MIGGTLLRFFRVVGPASMSLAVEKDDLLASYFEGMHYQGWLYCSQVFSLLLAGIAPLSDVWAFLGIGIKWLPSEGELGIRESPGGDPESLSGPANAPLGSIPGEDSLDSTSLGKYFTAIFFSIRMSRIIMSSVNYQTNY